MGFYCQLIRITDEIGKLNNLKSMRKIDTLTNNFNIKTVQSNTETIIK